MTTADVTAQTAAFDARDFVTLPASDRMTIHALATVALGMIDAGLIAEYEMHAAHALRNLPADADANVRATLRDAWIVAAWAAVWTQPAGARVEFIHRNLARAPFHVVQGAGWMVSQMMATAAERRSEAA